MVNATMNYCGLVLMHVEGSRRIMCANGRPARRGRRAGVEGRGGRRHERSGCKCTMGRRGDGGGEGGGAVAFRLDPPPCQRLRGGSGGVNAGPRGGSGHPRPRVSTRRARGGVPLRVGAGSLCFMGADAYHPSRRWFQCRRLAYTATDRRLPHHPPTGTVIPPARYEPHCCPRCPQLPPHPPHHNYGHSRSDRATSEGF